MNEEQMKIILDTITRAKEVTKQNSDLNFYIIMGILFAFFLLNNIMVQINTSIIFKALLSAGG